MRFWARNQTITCQELVELVTDYLEGALPARERRRFEGHIAGCPHCTAYIEQIQVTIRTLGRLEPESISAEAREDLLEAFRDWKRG
jgi:anti-sigma factor RsiW